MLLQFNELPKVQIISYCNVSVYVIKSAPEVIRITGFHNNSKRMRESLVRQGQVDYVNKSWRVCKLIITV
jgi:hypothetical protein